MCRMSAEWGWKLRDEAADAERDLEGKAKSADSDARNEAENLTVSAHRSLALALNREDHQLLIRMC